MRLGCAGFRGTSWNAGALAAKEWRELTPMNEVVVAVAARLGRPEAGGRRPSPPRPPWCTRSVGCECRQRVRRRECPHADHVLGGRRGGGPWATARARGAAGAAGAECPPAIWSMPIESAWHHADARPAAHGRDGANGVPVRLPGPAGRRRQCAHPGATDEGLQRRVQHGVRRLLLLVMGNRAVDADSPTSAAWPSPGPGRTL